jgi:hypothetical protein
MAGRLTEQLREATRAQSQLRPVRSDEASGGAVELKRAHGPFGWVSLLILAALFVGGWLLVRKLQADAKIQDCVMSGRKNCAPIDTDSLRTTPAPP